MEWTDEIKGILDSKKSKRLEIQAELNKLLFDLKTKVSPTKVELVSNNNDLSGWKVTIGEVTISIDEIDVDRSREIFAGNGLKLLEQKDLSESLKEMILNEFKQKN